MGYTVMFRGHLACPCLAEWLPVFEAELIRRGVIEHRIDIAQLIGTYSGSGGTHAEGGAFDIWQHDDVTVWVARQMGADATWARGAPFDPHAHGVLTDCPHNGPARYQIDEVRNGGDGLVGSAPDPGPRPLSMRTWRQGIAWARKQQEDDMAKYEEQLDEIQRVGDQTLQELRSFRRGKSESDQKVKAFLRQIVRQGADDATKSQAREILTELERLDAQDET